nr:outer membrane beta-barrel protein [Bacteroidales bacterium]
MKKVFLTLTLAAFAFAANAQIIVGGSLGYYNNGGKTTTEVKTASGSDVVEALNPTMTDFSIMPKIGYQINDNMQAGLILGFGMNQDKYFNGFSANDIYADWEGTRTENYNTITIKPYFRYNVMELGDFKLFVEAAIPYRMTSVTKWKTHETYTDFTDTKHDETAEGDDKTKSSSIGIEIVPGLNYSLTDNISLDVYINAIGLAFTSTTRTYENPDAPVAG